LYRFFDCHVVSNREQHMKVISHDHEVMNLKLSSKCVGSKHIDQEIGHSVALKQWSTLSRAGANKECA
jgi:hypothetical protein